MTGLEVALIVIGIIVIIASFIFSNKMDAETDIEKKSVEFTEKQKEDMLVLPILISTILIMMIKRYLLLWVPVRRMGYSS